MSQRATPHHNDSYHPAAPAREEDKDPKKSQPVCKKPQMSDYVSRMQPKGGRLVYRIYKIRRFLQTSTLLLSRPWS